MRVELRILRDSISWLGWHRGVLGLSVILAVALFVRLFSLATVPPNIVCDEADNLQLIYHILYGTGPGFFGLRWAGDPALSVHVQTLFVLLFGPSIVGLRMASVVFSLATVIAFYWLARQWLSVHASLAASFLLGTSLWFLGLSRTGWINVQVSLFAALAALALVRALRDLQWRWWIAAGVMCSLGLYGHLSGRLILASALAYAPLALLLHRERVKRLLLGFLVMLFVSALLFAPQLPAILENWGFANLRVESVSIFATGGSYKGDTSYPAILLHQVERTVRGFILNQGSVSGFGINARHIPPGRPFLDWITAVFFWLGMVVGLFRLRDKALWYVFLFVPLFASQVFSTGTPDVARAIGVVPFIYLFVGEGYQWLIEKVLGHKRILALVGIAAVLVSAYINVSEYFEWMGTLDAAAARQPAVEINEFDQWRTLQIEAARAGEWGFNVNQWHEMREDLSPSLPDEED